MPLIHKQPLVTWNPIKKVSFMGSQDGFWEGTNAKAASLSGMNNQIHMCKVQISQITALFQFQRNLPKLSVCPLERLNTVQQHSRKGKGSDLALLCLYNDSRLIPHLTPPPDWDSCSLKITFSSGIYIQANVKKRVSSNRGVWSPRERLLHCYHGEKRRGGQISHKKATLFLFP